MKCRRCGEEIINIVTKKQLVTIKKAHQITGASTSFFKQLLRERLIKRYKIHSATYISLVEFEALAEVNA